MFWAVYRWHLELKKNNFISKFNKSKCYFYLMNSFYIIFLLDKCLWIYSTYSIITRIWNLIKEFIRTPHSKILSPNSCSNFKSSHWFGSRSGYQFASNEQSSSLSWVCERTLTAIQEIQECVFVNVYCIEF